MNWLGRASDDVVLIASELVTNAVVHSGGVPEDLLSTRGSLDGDRMMISVGDPGVSDQTAEIRVEGDIVIGGWGLRIVDDLAVRWGSQREDGYRVWAEVPLAPAS